MERTKRKIDRGTKILIIFTLLSNTLGLLFVENLFAEDNEEVKKSDFIIKLNKKLKEDKNAREKFIKICSENFAITKDDLESGRFPQKTFLAFKNFINKYPNSISSLTIKLIICRFLCAPYYSPMNKNKIYNKICQRLCREIIKNHPKTWQSVLARRFIDICRYFLAIIEKDEKKADKITFESVLRFYPLIKKIEKEWNKEKEYFFRYYRLDYSDLKKDPQSLSYLDAIRDHYEEMGKKKKAIEILRKMIEEYPESTRIDDFKLELKWLEEEVRKEQEKKKKNSDKSNKTSKNKRAGNTKRKDKASFEKTKNEHVKFRNEKIKESDKIKKDKYNETKKTEEAEVEYLPYIIGISILVAAFVIFIVSIKTSKKI